MWIAIAIMLLVLSPILPPIIVTVFHAIAPLVEEARFRRLPARARSIRPRRT